MFFVPPKRDSIGKIYRQHSVTSEVNQNKTELTEALGMKV